MTAKIDSELLKQAIIATDDYLGIYKNAKSKGHATDKDIHDFTAKLSVAMEALKKFNESENHNLYIEATIAKMAQLYKDEDISLFDDPVSHTPRSSGESESVEVKGNKIDEVSLKTTNPCWKGYKPVGVKKKNGKTVPNCVPESFKDSLTKDKKNSDLSDKDIDKIANSIEWGDFEDLYSKDEFVQENLSEKLSAVARFQKRVNFSRTSSKRGIALQMKLHRPASSEIMLRRAKVAARRLLTKRLLQGRDKSQLSAQQKDEIESRIKAMGNIQRVLVQKLIPVMRNIERKRLKK
jgi:hypothetical protein